MIATWLRKYSQNLVKEYIYNMGPIQGAMNRLISVAAVATAVGAKASKDKKKAQEKASSKDMHKKAIKKAQDEIESKAEQKKIFAQRVQQTKAKLQHSENVNNKIELKMMGLGGNR